MYKIIFDSSKRFKKDLICLKKNQPDYLYLQKKLYQFSQNPFDPKWNLKKMEPKEEKLFRLRLGDLRIIFDIDTGNKVIVVYRINYRKDVYKK